MAEANLSLLNDLKSQKFKYVATDSGSHKSLLDSLLVEHSITLRLGAQVMLMKNIDESLINGLVGTVIGFYQSWEAIPGPLESNSEVKFACNYIQNITLQAN